MLRVRTYQERERRALLLLRNKDLTQTNKDSRTALVDQSSQKVPVKWISHLEYWCMRYVHTYTRRLGIAVVTWELTARSRVRYSLPKRPGFNCVVPSG